MQDEHGWNVTVDAQGFICYGDERLSQAEAISLATHLAQAVEKSIWRTQIADNPGYYHDSQRILERQEAPLGKAISALRAVF